MKAKTALLLFGFLTATLPLAARNYVLDVSPTDAPAVAAQYGLTLIKQIPNHSIFLVSGSDSVSASDEINLVSSDPRVTNFELARLSSNPESNSVDLNQSTAGILDNTTSVVTYFGNAVPDTYVTQPAADHINLAAAQSAFNAWGAGRVAIIDTGIDPAHPALQGVLAPGVNLITGSPTTDPNEFLDIDQSTAGILDQSTAGILDQNTVVVLSQSTAAILDQSTAGILDPSTVPLCFGHGTEVAGIVHLVAPAATIVPIKAFHSDCTGSLYDVIAAIYHAVDVDKVDAINMSWDIGTNPSKELNSAINYANSNGVIMVGAVGNSDQKISVWPAASDNVFGIASTSIDPTTGADYQSPFTNYGPVVALAAPGSYVKTTYPGGFYAKVSGTSFSTPFVTGTVALLQQFQPNLNYSGADNYLSRANRINSNLGYGLLDVYGSVSLAAK